MEEINQIVPEEFIKRAQLLFCNGFCGYQAPGCGISNDKVAFCWCADLAQEQVEQIKTNSGSTTLIHDDFIGHGYLTVLWNEYNKIPTIFNTMLQLGLWFKTNNKAAAIFRPADDPVFSEELMEKKCIENVKEILELMPNCLHDSYYIKDAYLEPWNYKTDEGKEFCKYLRNKKHLDDLPLDHKDNHYLWPIFQNYDPETLLTLPEVVEEAPNKKLKEEQVEAEVEEKEEDLQECMICLDKVADTMVLPCEHVCVCKECSAGLRNTNDHHTCVRCRRDITDILE
jgi:hypothetical protein